MNNLDLFSPKSFNFPTAETVSVNGSSQVGNCSTFTAPSISRLSRCTTPTSSVLFDGNIPTLTGLDGLVSYPHCSYTMQADEISSQTSQTHPIIQEWTELSW